MALSKVLWTIDGNSPLHHQASERTNDRPITKQLLGSAMLTSLSQPQPSELRFLCMVWIPASVPTASQVRPNLPAREFPVISKDTSNAEHGQGGDFVVYASTRLASAEAVEEWLEIRFIGILLIRTGCVGWCRDCSNFAGLHGGWDLLADACRRKARQMLRVSWCLQTNEVTGIFRKHGWQLLIMHSTGDELVVGFGLVADRVVLSNCWDHG